MGNAYASAASLFHPHAERTLIGACAYNADHFQEAWDLGVRAETFGDPAKGRLWTMMGRLQSRGVLSYSAVMDAAERHPEPADLPALPDLDSWIGSEAHTLLIGPTARHLLEVQQRRYLARLAERLKARAERADESPVELAEIAVAALVRHFDLGRGA